ncbi:AraC family transcriptional regulator [Paenibacillus sp. USHLN196]|uniref:AraC family transcriptional regulator n=1 Tax=Paenibacillus sp. USHLN196 TaxID=3081291 RepID=UPI0030199CC1
MTIESSFRRANHICNRYITKVEQAGLSVSVLYWGFMPDHFDNALHRHSFFEACYVVDGEGSYFEQNRQYALNKGTAFLSLPGEWHQIRSQTGLTLCYVAFELDEVPTDAYYAKSFRRLAELGQNVVPQADITPTGHLWQALIASFDLPGATLSLAVKQISASLLLSIADLHAPAPADSADTAEQPAETNTLFRQAKRYIDDNMNNELTLVTVSKHLHISSRHLTRLFQENLGQSFVHYIQERRVQHAAWILLNEQTPIKDIAIQCGFQSVHYFTRIFTRELGVSPAKFRRIQFAEGRSGQLHYPPKMS